MASPVSIHALNREREELAREMRDLSPQTSLYQRHQRRISEINRLALDEMLREAKIAEE